MANIRIKGGTRAQLNAAATANKLAAREPYLITDEGRLAVGTGAGTYTAMAKAGEGGVPAPIAMSVTYSAGRVSSVTEDGVTTNIGYDSKGRVLTVSYPHNGKTRTETYSYTNGFLTGMSATDA